MGLVAVFMPLIFACDQPAESVEWPRLGYVLVDSVPGEFSYSPHMAITRDGHVYASQPTDATVLSLGEGVTKQVLGGRGEGPGEFGTVSRIGAVDTSLWVYDGRLKRFSLWSQSGRLELTLPLPLSLLGERQPEVVLPTGLGVAARNEVVVAGTDVKMAPLASLGLGQKAVFLMNSSDGQVRELATIPGAPHCAIVLANGVITKPFCALNHVDVASSAGRLVVAEADSATVGLMRIRAFAFSGEEIFLSEVWVEPREVPGEVRDSARAELRERATDREIGELSRYYPPLRRMFVSTEGQVWLELDHSGGEHKWLILSEVGTVRGTLLVPPNVRIMAAGDSVAWGTASDSDGVPAFIGLNLASP